MLKNFTLNVISDYKDLTNSKQDRRHRDLRAFCTSQQCMGSARFARYNKCGVEKTVSKAKVDCPDCGSALVWQDTNDTRIRKW
jgi:hypothetical protein